ncbi:helix-turn-helix domain-containing protein [Micromonospora sp. WMMD1082]|uniref:helix-turn-helix domain-containing protein n=1 Tax=Micromonospora sp. WMMD1082 TaxID=3016104 RepID=UPI002417F490|nr:helix-turn-helix domain-containing protein [Micromonospora sp. WMMD1082]MDG4794157.1 helix-turn-helix domain-containing protein [Micromonospora sp. WMMD1082]
MTGRERRDHNAVPIGRRVAELRAHRGMSQQVFADRLGKSKSWVDKIERGVRTLDRYSVIQDIATVLRLDPAALLGPRQPLPGTPRADGIDAVRAALARYHHQPCQAMPPDQARQHIAHAWLAYQRAHYTQLLRALPALLGTARGTPALLLPAYRITASILTKLGEADLAWLAADRAVTTADGNPTGTGTATIAVAQALRALGRDDLALTAAVVATTTPAHHTVRGTLLLQAGLAAAGCDDRRNAGDLIDHAAELADRRTDDSDPHHTSFGPTTVQLARFLAALHLGDIAEAVYRHEDAIRRDGWRRLPPEHRAAHLVDAARTYLHAGDYTAAARALVDADVIAPAEIRCRPTVRTLVADLARSGPATASVARLATIVGLTR